MGRGPGPQRLALALAELIAQRGYARVRGDKHFIVNPAAFRVRAGQQV